MVWIQILHIKGRETKSRRLWRGENVPTPKYDSLAYWLSCTGYFQEMASTGKALKTE